MARVLAGARWVARRAVVLGILAVLGFGAGATLAVVYGQFGSHPGRNADAWAARDLAFTGNAASCAACHAAQATAWASARHAGVTCESCHGPLEGHPAKDPHPRLLAPEVAPARSPDLEPVAAAGRVLAGAPVATGAPAIETSAATSLCLSCHRATVGRPAGFPTIDPLAHYTGPTCVACHDPHTAVAPQPPIIRHPLLGLPECTVCHNPTGLRPMPASHPTVSGSCLACHKPIQP